MKNLSQLFEKGLEHFLSKNKEKQIRVISWMTLGLLTACFIGGFYVANMKITLKDEHGVEQQIPVRKLLLNKISL